jgi:hypothetical protein
MAPLRHLGAKVPVGQKPPANFAAGFKYAPAPPLFADFIVYHHLSQPPLHRGQARPLRLFEISDTA